VKAEAVRLGRFDIRTKPRKRIERATHGAAHYLGKWLIVDGKSVMRGDEITPEQLERAEVRLGWGPLDNNTEARFSDTRFSCRVDYRCGPAAIETAWMVVADLVCGERWEP
jgi:hypothetical protein